MANFLIVFLSLNFLIILHELSHFLMAKRCGVKIEEFGIGFPPRLFGKKIGETVYSLNILPLGAFVKLPGEIERIEEAGSFSQQPLSKRFLIVLAGVISFWIISTIVFIFLYWFGNPVVISDEERVDSSFVKIIGIAPNSPAELAGIKIGDQIVTIKTENGEIKITTVKEVQEITKENKGKEVLMVLKRGENLIEKRVVPRQNPPEGEGPLGVVLSRMTFEKYPLFFAIFKGIKNTFDLTIFIIGGYLQAIKNLIVGKPTGVEVVGPVGIFQIAFEMSKMGLLYFFNFFANLSISLAVLNILPIPSTDGGKTLFLTIEALRKKPVSPKIEQRITTVFFAFFLFLGIVITFRDIIRLF